MSKLAWIGSTARWAKNDFAEWFAGTWALVLGWFIFGVIFYNLMLMDGHFSRGLGEGSGVNPDRFQQMGWMYRAFAALFLVFGTKLTLSALKKHAIAVRIIGGFISVIVILHATGFGLKALEGKRDNATAIEAVAEAQTGTNDALLAQLRKQIADIDTQLEAAVAPINAEIINLDTDKLAANDRRSDGLRERRTTLEDRAAAAKAPINAQITELIASGGAVKTENAGALATNEKWAPLFVGLAQLATWNPEPSDWAIYVCAVLFIIFWVLVGDAIAIVLPDALYRMHLSDAKARKINISADAFKDLQAQADELARRKANLDDGAERANITKKRKKNRAQSLKILEDQREAAAKEADARKQEIEAAIAEMQSEPEDDEPPAPPEPDYPVPAVIPETPAEHPAVEETDAQNDDESERGPEEEDADGRGTKAA